MTHNHPTKHRIAKTLQSTGKSLRQLTEEIPLSRATLSKIYKAESYSFPSYEKIVAYCASICPDEDWSYPSLEELTLFYIDNIIPKEEGVSPNLRTNFIYNGLTPKVDNYSLLCDLKLKMEANANVQDNI